MFVRWVGYGFFVEYFGEGRCISVGKLVVVLVVGMCFFVFRGVGYLVRVVVVLVDEECKVVFFFG